MEISAPTMMEAWKAAIRLILEEGIFFIDEQKRECYEVTSLVVRVENPSSAGEGVRAMRVSRNWRYPSEEELANIILNKESASIYDYLYGSRIFSYHDTTNQIENYIIPLLAKRPNSRRAMVALVDPEHDLKLESRSIMSLSLLHFRILEGKLCVTAVLRTSGFFTGWPANVFQIAKLQEYVARALSLPAGSITTISLAAHVHVDTFEDIATVLGKELVDVRRA